MSNAGDNLFTGVYRTIGVGMDFSWENLTDGARAILLRLAIAVNGYMWTPDDDPLIAGLSVSGWIAYDDEKTFLTYSGAVSIPPDEVKRFLEAEREGNNGR